MPTARLTYTEVFFENIVRTKLGYDPRIEIKPAHLANGLFRAVCGQYYNNEAQHMAFVPKFYPVLDPGKLTRNDKLRERLRAMPVGQGLALTFLSRQPRARAMLNSLLGADKTLFRSVNTSAYSLSHVSHVTSDNHDRQAGRWLNAMLLQGANHQAWDLLKRLLMEEAMGRNDELSVLTLPLVGDPPVPKFLNADYVIPESLNLDISGEFRNSLIRALRRAFNLLAANDNPSASQNGKLDTLRHFVTLSCLAVYIHMANAAQKDRLTPIVFCCDRSLPTIQRASISSYQQVRSTLDAFFVDAIVDVLTKLSKEGTHGAWDSDEAIEHHLTQTIDWAKNSRQSMMAVQKTQADCFRFYQSYRSATANQTPLVAMSRALKDMQGLMLSSTPQDVARALGTRIGLLSPHAERHKKTYDPHPDVLEVLIRATLPAGSTMPLRDIAQIWADDFGILVGVLGDENKRLASDAIAADPYEWQRNGEALAETLETSGYARRYADGVVLVKLG